LLKENPTLWLSSSLSSKDSIFSFISSVPAGFFLVKQCSSCFPSLAIGKAFTQLQKSKHHSGFPLQLFFSGLHELIWTYQLHTADLPADICSFIL